MNMTDQPASAPAPTTRRLSPTICLTTPCAVAPRARRTPIAGLEAPPERLGVPHDTAHEFLVDDHLRRRRGVVEIHEVGSRPERDPHCPEIAGRDEVAERPIGGRIAPGATFEREGAQREAM